MNNQPIGVLDSGLGGLTAVKPLLELAPQENVVFFGDNARVPYGTRAPATIIHFALQDISFLLARGIKLIVAACGTISSTLPADIAARIPVPFIGVIEPTAAAAVCATRNGQVGILGTLATINSGSFQRALKNLNPDIVPVASACPMLVPLVENGFTGRNCEVTRQVAAAYLAPLRQAGVDTVILGCTHYPIIQDIIADLMGDDVAIIDSGRETARRALEMLAQSGSLNEDAGHLDSRQIEYNITDNPDGFGVLAELFLGRELGGRVSLVPVDDLSIHPCFQEVT